jgi:two-component system invasion response regulator UvrY
MDASGYWTKHACFAKIVAAIHEVMSGKQSFCPEVAKYLHKTPAGLRFDPPHEHPALAVLTPREANLFLLLAQGNSVGQSAKQLGIKEQTAENRRLGIMRKLHIHETDELVQLAKKEGIIE